MMIDVWTCLYLLCAAICMLVYIYICKTRSLLVLVFRETYSVIKLRLPLIDRLTPWSSGDQQA